jgi:hypothetical protein
MDRAASWDYYLSSYSFCSCSKSSRGGIPIPWLFRDVGRCSRSPMDMAFAIDLNQLKTLDPESGSFA